MEISKAVRLAFQTQKGITRRLWMPNGPILLPTNSKSGCIIEPYSPKGMLGKRWQPSADDLVADDWVAVGKLDKRD